MLVHGTGGVHSRWAPVLPALEQRFRVYAVERRGRGQSGDAIHYAIEREFEDIAAVVSSIDEPVNLLGHSFGAICALEAALLLPDLHRLILYEPPIPVEGVPVYPPGVIERLQTFLEAGEREEVLACFMREVVHMPAAEFELFRSSPAWPARLAAAHTLPRELGANEHYRFEPQRFKELITPTLLLVGGDSLDFFRAAAAAVNAAIPTSRVRILPGQQHIAMDTAPQLFVREVVAFLSETEAEG